MNLILFVLTCFIGGIVISVSIPPPFGILMCLAWAFLTWTVWRPGQ